MTTTNFREGYLRKNGVPYSENASITEYFHRLPEQPGGDVWLHVVTIVEDPKYLSEPFYTSAMFKREPNGSKWKPTECRTAPPPAAPAVPCGLATAGGAASVAAVARGDPLPQLFEPRWRAGEQSVREARRRVSSARRRLRAPAAR